MNSSSELNKLKSKLKSIDVNNKEQRAQIQRQIQLLGDQQRQFKREKENKDIRRALKKAKTDQTRHVISKLKKLRADPSTDPALLADTEQVLRELKVGRHSAPVGHALLTGAQALSLEALFAAWPQRATVSATEGATHAVLTRATKLHAQPRTRDTELSEERSADEQSTRVDKKGLQRAESYFMHSLGGEKERGTKAESFFTGSLGNDSDSEPIEHVEVTKKKNRPGQRTRRRMAEELRQKGALGPAPSSKKRSFSELESDADKSVKRRKVQHAEADKHHNHKAEPSADAGQLHPSWRAIKQSKEAQRVVLDRKSKAVVFDSDEE